MSTSNGFTPAPSLVATVEQEWGDKGRRWLAELPNLLLCCERHWRVRALPSTFTLTYNYVTVVVREDGTEAVLKVGPSPVDFRTEVRALRAFAGRSVVRLLDADHRLGAMLLERIAPGTDLEAIQPADDRTATTAAAAVIRDLPVPVPPGSRFPRVRDWAAVLQRVLLSTGGSGPLPGAVIRKAQALFAEMDSGNPEQRLLHGDLHHGNILLDSGRGRVATDPKGVIGDPVFEVARFLNSPNPQLLSMKDPRRVIADRLDILASFLMVDRRRLLSWAYIDCAIGACSWIETGGTTCTFSAGCAELFDELWAH